METIFLWIQWIQQIWQIYEAWIRGQLIDPVCYSWLGGCIVIYWAVTQEVAGSNNILIAISCHWIEQNPNELVYSDHSMETVSISESKKLQKASYEIQKKVPVLLTWSIRNISVTSWSWCHWFVSFLWMGKIIRIGSEKWTPTVNTTKFYFPSRKLDIFHCRIILSNSSQTMPVSLS